MVSGPTRVSILGATGSIGTSALDLVREQRDRYEIVALAAKRDAGKLAALAREFGAELAVIADPSRHRELRDALAGTAIRTEAGPEAIVAAAIEPSDVIITAITGAAGLAPTIAALAPGRRVALANKECLVSAGRLFMRTARARGALVLPVDSEHNAIFQVLAAGGQKAIERVTLTASGGPFREFTPERLRRVTPEEALRHPTWSMGAKVTIDSATLMNKGLELIEAHHLFDLPADKLDILIHPQSIVHALATYRDGSVLAGMSVADMRIPLAVCLAWPERLAWAAPRLDLGRLGHLTFEPPNFARFPALGLARAALAAGGAAPTVLNAANEVAVAAFLERRIGFLDIAGLVESVLLQAAAGRLAEPESIEQALDIDHTARSIAATLLPQFAAKAS